MIHILTPLSIFYRCSSECMMVRLSSLRDLIYILASMGAGDVRRGEVVRW